MVSGCKCVGVEVGSYDNQVVLTPPLLLRRNTPEGEPAKTVCVDACLVEEVAALWRLGIRTTGCCCGHGGQAPAYIGVVEADIGRMEALGYVVLENRSRPGAQDSFSPLWRKPKVRLRFIDGFYADIRPGGALCRHVMWSAAVRCAVHRLADHD